MDGNLLKYHERITKILSDYHPNTYLISIWSILKRGKTDRNSYEVNSGQRIFITIPTLSNIQKKTATSAISQSATRQEYAGGKDIKFPHKDFLIICFVYVMSTIARKQ